MKKATKVASPIKAKVIFISSSYVFDGKKGDYSETDPLNPENVYGIEKIKAEKKVLESGGLVLRVDIMYGYNSKNNPNGVFDKILSNKEIEERNPTQLRTPLFIDDVAQIIIKLIENNQSGIFNVAGPDKITIYDFQKQLEEIARKNKDSKIKIINDPNALIKPPMNTTLNTKKINSLRIYTTPLKQGLKKLKEQFERDNWISLAKLSV